MLKSIFTQFIAQTRRTIWAILVAYMVGIHNFYKGEDKTSENIVITSEVNEQHERGTPKD
jgi:hypothetical protein